MTTVYEATASNLDSITVRLDDAVEMVMCPSGDVVRRLIMEYADMNGLSRLHRMTKLSLAVFKGVFSEFAALRQVVDAALEPHAGLLKKIGSSQFDAFELARLALADGSASVSRFLEEHLVRNHNADRESTPSSGHVISRRACHRGSRIIYPS